METIEILIDKEGKLHIDAKGFKDSSCLKALAKLEELFGKAENVTMKAEGKHHERQTDKQKA